MQCCNIKYMQVNYRMTLCMGYCKVAQCTVYGEKSVILSPSLNIKLHKSPL